MTHEACNYGRFLGAGDGQKEKKTMGCTCNTTEPAHDVRYRVKDRGERNAMSTYYIPRYSIVYEKLVWQEKEYAATDDKEAAEKIAALMNGGLR